VQAGPAVTTFLFTDIEASTRLWQQEPEAMHGALASHDAIVRGAVEGNHGDVVKMSGDGVHAAFADPLHAVKACLQLQQALADPATTRGIALRVRCGLHAGVDQRRDNDFFGNAVNRAARIMSAAHGGQVLVSQVVAGLVGERLPSGVFLRDLGTVRLRDLAMPEHLYQLAGQGLRQDFPALRSLEATPNNLPQQLTSFIGREHEVPEVERLLAGARLLTLFGAGGIGKTRLSLQVAADVMDDYPDGVWLVELAPLGDGSLVAQSVASVLGVKEEPGRTVVEALSKYVKKGRMLIVLDNCEHLLQPVAELARQLLQAGPQLKILATSREHLHIAGETTHLVPPLASPTQNETAKPEELVRYEAVRLFVERAEAAQPGFRLTTQNAAAVTDICTRLDGIPLAIELAAARVRALSVETIDARLGDRFRLLTGGDRTALPRQQTLRALIDWSYDLLTEGERGLLRRLAVFAGGWTLEAAEAVGTGGEISLAQVLDLLTHLTEKSLVTPEAGGGRFRLLETVRQYAVERLDESGEAGEVRTRHLAFFLALVEKARPQLVGPGQRLWLAKLDPERENILAAHSWCDRAEGGADLGVSLVYAIKPYCFNRGQLDLGHRLTVEALARKGAQSRSTGRCKVLCDAGQYCSFMGRYREAQKHLEESLAIARELGNRDMIARVLQPLSMALLGQGLLTEARTHLEEALALAMQLGDKRELAGAINALAQIQRIQNDLEAAEPLCEQVVALARELGDREITAIGLLNLAMVLLGRGSIERARTSLLEAAKIAEETGSRPAGQSVLEVSSALSALRADWEQSARFYGAAEALMESTGMQRDPTDDAFLQPFIAKARDALGSAAFASFEQAGRALSYFEALGETHTWLKATGG
jgi:predicted ATPase/class 3 adenylate cyclase